MVEFSYIVTGNVLKAEEQMPMEEAAFPAASESLGEGLGVLGIQAGSDRCSCRGWTAEEHHEKVVEVTSIWSSDNQYDFMWLPMNTAWRFLCHSILPVKKHGTVRHLPCGSARRRRAVQTTWNEAIRLFPFCFQDGRGMLVGSKVAWPIFMPEKKLHP